MTPDYYSILGVTPTSEDVVIHAAYRALMRRYHPDSNTAGEAADRAQRINEAYAVLSDPERRARYDGSLAAEGLIKPAPVRPRGGTKGLAMQRAPAAAIALVAMTSALLAVALWSPLPGLRMPSDESGRIASQNPGAAEQSRRLASTNDVTDDLCTKTHVNELIKNELFRRAAQLSGTNEESFARVASHSVLRIDSSVSKSGTKAGNTDCSAWVAVDLPPGVSVGEGRRNLNGEVVYRVASSSTRGLRLASISKASALVRPLATLVRTLDSAEDSIRRSDRIAAEPTEAVGRAPEPVRAVSVLGGDRPQASPKTAAGSKPAPAPKDVNSKCAALRNRIERSVCESSKLAALDRHSALLYRQSFAVADADRRKELVNTRERFAARLNACRSETCLSAVYLARLREVSDIMAGRRQP